MNLEEKLIISSRDVETIKIDHEEEKVRKIVEDLLIGVKNINYTIANPQVYMNMTGIEIFIFYFFNILCMILIFPIFLGFYTIQPQESIIIMVFGKIMKISNSPGLNWYFPIFTTIHHVNQGLRTMELKGNSVPDCHGSPLNVSAIITFRVEEPVKSLFNVDNYYSYVRNQSDETLKRVVSRFPYRSNNPNQPTILTDTLIIGKCMKELLKEKVKIAGIDIIRMELMEYSYHPEVAQGLLQIQQAQAKLEARKIIVEGGVSIVKDALEHLDQTGIKVTEESRQKIIQNLLTVICSEFGPPQPFLKV